MKISGAITALATLGCADAFVLPASGTAVRQKTARSAERMNEKVDLDKPKVRMYRGHYSTVTGITQDKHA